MFKKKAKKITKYTSKNRMVWVFGIFVLAFVALMVRLGWYQIFNASYYSQKATKQQISDSVVSAIRGEIVDKNGNALAASATTNTIWVRPSSVKSNGSTDEEVESNARAEASILAEILELDAEDVYETITAEKTLIKVAKHVDAETTALVREADLTGIEIVENASRVYPLGAFASHIVGITDDDNEGLTGLELYYNRYLSGINGRLITTKDKNSKSLVYGTSKYYDAEDGYTIVTTIDENIQYIVESTLDEYLEITKATRIMCLVMDPKTGGILAMAQTNDFDPNNPRDPAESDAEEFSKMSDSEKLTYWNKMWRCFCISDTYEPGSTFKPITASIALDTGHTNLSKTYECTGSIKVGDKILRCWDYPKSHGKQTLTEVLEHSCNPGMVQIMQTMTAEEYYEGLDAFGLTAKSGIDYPGEASNIIYDIDEAGPVELATMSYGQGISVTPISLITAISSLANDGKVMQPHFMSAILDSDGNTIESFTPTVRSVSVSEQTASDMLGVMEKVVSEGGGGSAKISGYRIAGKTGTASKPVTGGYSESDYYSSFIGIAPVDDPQFTILVVVDSPQGRIYGSQTAAPCAKAIMQDVLQYLNIQPSYSESELKKLQSDMTTVPDVVGCDIENASGILAGAELTYQLSPAIDESTSHIVIIDQYPKSGDEVLKNSTVTLYYEVVEGDTLDEAN